MRQKKYPVTNIGTSLILSVFIILALVTFAVLSMINTSHDYEFTEKIADRTARYYEASNEAEEILAQIDNAAQSSYTEDAEAYFSTVGNLLSQKDDLTVEASDESCRVVYSVAIGDTQALDVEIEILHPESLGDTYYKIHKWQEVSTEEWSSDAKMNLL